MKKFILSNYRCIPRSNISTFPLLTLRDQVISLMKTNDWRLIAWMGYPESNTTIGLLAVLANDEQSQLWMATTSLQLCSNYPALTPEIPAFHMVERELFEAWGITPINHPWLKPVRFPITDLATFPAIANYPFLHMTGEASHEVGVGPIHAGIIEPGHFRFLCHGETVMHLEIQLGYQHRGIETLLMNAPTNQGILLAESIAGDSVIAHGSTYIQIMESLSGISIPMSVYYARAIALELERIAMHLADLSALAGDVGYLLGNSIFGAIRTRVINTFLNWCGNRFGRGLLQIGGMSASLSLEQISQLNILIQWLANEVDIVSETMFSSSTVLSRMEHNCILTNKQAYELGCVGLVARASDIAMDIRADHPFGAYRKITIDKVRLKKGGIFARAYLRYIEIKQSLFYIEQALKAEPFTANIQQKEIQLQPSSIVVGLTEGWRGEIAHIAMTNEQGKLISYKIKDPSFNNWFGLTLAMRNNAISDFPLCNKSFSLSYAGFDL